MPTPLSSRLARPSHCAVMLGVLAMGALPAAAQSGPAESAAVARTFTFDLPAASLYDTLRAITRVSGVSIGVDENLVVGKHAPAVAGTLSAGDAMAAALAGSGLKLLATASGYRVAAGDAESIVVVARRDQAETSFKADRSDTATRSGTSLMEIPAGVTILTSKVLESQQSLSVRDALANVSGMSFKQTPQGTPTFGVRGYGETALTVNGVADNSASLTNVLTVERIEVLKGPQAILSGAGSLGGGVNVVTKKPQADPYGALLLQIGSHRDITLGGDITRAVSEDRRLSMRLIGAVSQAKDNAAGFDGRKDVSLLPQLRWKDERTDLIVGASYGKQRGPVPEYTFGRRDGVIMPAPQLLLGRPEDGFDTRQRRLFYQLEQTIAADVVLVSRLQRSLQDTEVNVRTPAGLNYGAGAANDSPNGSVSFFASRSEQDQNATSGDHYLRIQGSTGPVSHKLSVGVNHNTTASHQPNWSGPTTTVQVYPPASGTPFGDLRTDASTLSSVSDQTTKQLDTFAQDLLNWGDWSLLLNLRQTHYSTEGTSLIPPNFTVFPKKSVGRSTPGVGLVYAVTPEISLYTNYAEGFVPSTLPLCGGGFVPPKSTRNREAGAKFDLFDSRLSITTAAYELAQSNTSVFFRPGNCYNVRDAQLSRGVELDVQGELTRGLNVLMNYTFTTAKDVGNPNAVFTGVSKHKLSLWTTYAVQDETWRGLGFGAGISGASRSRGSTSTRFTEQYIPGQAQIDASVFYTAGPWTSTFGVKNIANRELYAATPGFEFIPIKDGRNFMFTVKREFN